LNPGQFCFIFLLSLFHLENHVCLSHGVQNQGGVGFPGLGLKIGSSGLVICALKSPQRFLGLDLKIK
jgi:hypothetical protein